MGKLPRSSGLSCPGVLCSVIHVLDIPMSGGFFDQASGGLIDFVLLGVAMGKKHLDLGNHFGGRGQGLYFLSLDLLYILVM